MIDTNNTLTLVIDIQEKLFPHIHKKELLLHNVQILVQGLSTLSVPLIVSEQYKKGLGATLPDLQKHLGDATLFEKTAFSCVADKGIRQAIETHDKKYILLCGIETHICVLQTALDLKQGGYTPIIIADCVGSRKTSNHEIALAQCMQEKIRISSYESILFELLKDSTHPQFRTISALVK